MAGHRYTLIALHYLAVYSIPVDTPNDPVMTWVTLCAVQAWTIRSKPCMCTGKDSCFIQILYM